MVQNRIMLFCFYARKFKINTCLLLKKPIDNRERFPADDRPTIFDVLAICHPSFDFHNIPKNEGCLKQITCFHESQSWLFAANAR
jgi:hypothetical protein